MYQTKPITPKTTSPLFDQEIMTPSGLRLRRKHHTSGALNWIFFAGGPGLGSESLLELVDAIDVPGNCWLADLPGDGSNTLLTSRADDCFSVWPGVASEAAHVLENCIFTGHSTGGMYLLSVPELEQHLKGLVLISSAPNQSWQADFARHTLAMPLPAVTSAHQAFLQQPDNQHLGELVKAAAPWNFTDAGLARGLAMLAHLPYNVAAYNWSEQHFDQHYRALWWPQTLPTMIISGAQDCVVNQALWDDPAYRGSHVQRHLIAGAGHFPWLENPDALRQCYAQMAQGFATE